MKARDLAALAAAVFLSGCGSLGGSTGDQLYVLHAPAAAASNVARVEATLQLLRPVAQPGLDTARIAVAQPGNRLDYFARGRWAGSLEQVAESLFVQTLRGSGRFAQVASDAAGMGADFVLAVTLRRFELEYAAEGSAPRAKVVLECTLSSRREHRQVASFNIATETQAGANRLGSAVAALELAAQEASRQLVDRAAEAAARALAEERAGGRTGAPRN